MRASYRGRHVALVAAIVMGSGCAMRVSGMVLDAHTHAPIAGALIAPNDGRQRVRRSDEAGHYAVKTDSDTVSMIVSAPGYHALTVAIPTGSRYPEVQVALVPVEPARKAEPTYVPVGLVPVPQRSTTAELEEVEDLYNRGLISADEYKRMRTRIVDGE